MKEMTIMERIFQDIEESEREARRQVAIDELKRKGINIEDSKEDDENE